MNYSDLRYFIICQLLQQSLYFDLSIIILLYLNFSYVFEMEINDYFIIKTKMSSE